MNILYFLAVSVALWWRAVAPPPPLDTISAELQLDTDETVVTRAGSDSYVYHFPNPKLRVTDGTTMNVFGVMTVGDFTLHLLPLKDTPKPEPLTITKKVKGWDLQYSSVSRHYKDSFVMPKDKFVWFIIERTNSYLALYRVPDPNPVLVVSNHVLKNKINFNDLQKFRVSSTEEAFWDFQGFKYDQKEGTAKYPFLEATLEKVRKAYGKVAAHLKRCEYADKHIKTAADANNERFFLTFFIDRNCRDKKIVGQLKDMAVRYRAQLLAAGITPPKQPNDEQCKKYIMDSRSLKF